jgi:hypothetical protein
MLNKYEKLLRKLDRPPSAPNWVRFVCDDPLQSAKAIFSFVNGRPSFNYFPSYKASKDRIELRISREEALAVARNNGAPLGRERNEELVEAFFDYDEVRTYSASNPIGFEKEYFRISRDVQVPVAPISVIREHGKFVPIFMCGWESIPLRLRQRRLLMTVYEDAFLSLTDYQTSPAQFLFFPKLDRSKERSSLPWLRGDYELLSKKQLNECVEIFLLARELVRKKILEKMEQELGVKGGPDGGAGPSPAP